MILSTILWLPLLTSPLTYLIGKKKEEYARYFAIIISLIVLGLASYLWLGFNLNATTQFQFREEYAWVPTVGITYLLGVDGISLPMVFLTALITSMAIISSVHIEERKAQYFALVLFLETGILGVFMALDLFLFYVFWEIVLVPMFFLIAIWGGPRRKYAAFKFLIYTHVASVIMLITFFAIYWIYGQNTGVYTFNILKLSGFEAPMGLYDISIPMNLKLILFAALFFGFAVKVPSVPVHTWLPDAHVEAPSPISAILAGLLLKMGGYGIIRFSTTLFPDIINLYGWYVAIIGLISIFYAALVAMYQIDMKRLIAYSSISHMGFVVLGVASGTEIGIVGAMFMMFSHGLINGLMFLLSGVYKARFHTRDIPKISGFTTKMPIAAGILVFGSFASSGLPGLSGFWAEFLTILGAFNVWELNVAIVVFGAVIMAGALLWMLQRIVFGPQKEQVEHEIKDVTPSELIPLAILAFFIVLLGIYPDLLISLVSGPAYEIASLIRGG